MVIPSVQELEDRVLAQSSEVEALRAAIQRASEMHDSRIDKLGYAVDSLEASFPNSSNRALSPSSKSCTSAYSAKCRKPPARRWRFSPTGFKAA